MNISIYLYVNIIVHKLSNNYESGKNVGRGRAPPKVKSVNFGGRPCVPPGPPMKLIFCTICSIPPLLNNW